MLTDYIVLKQVETTNVVIHPSRPMAICNLIIKMPRSHQCETTLSIQERLSETCLEACTHPIRPKLNVSLRDHTWSCTSVSTLNSTPSSSESSFSSTAASSIEYANDTDTEEFVFEINEETDKDITDSDQSEYLDSNSEKTRLVL